MHATGAAARGVSCLGVAAGLLVAGLTAAGFLDAIGVDARIAEVLLAHIPRTRLVEGDVDAWWRDRDGWFFKPHTGFGSRGAANVWCFSQYACHLGSIVA